MTVGIMSAPGIKTPGDYINEVMGLVKAKNPAEPEFHQAVQEVMESFSARGTYAARPPMIDAVPAPIPRCFPAGFGVFSFRRTCYKRYCLARLSPSGVIAVTAKPPERDSNTLFAKCGVKAAVNRESWPASVFG